MNKLPNFLANLFCSHIYIFKFALIRSTYQHKSGVCISNWQNVVYLILLLLFFIEFTEYYNLYLEI